MVVFSTATAEVSAEVASLIPGVDYPSKAAYLAEEILRLNNFPDTVVCCPAQGRLELKGVWDALVKVYATLEVWIKGQECLPKSVGVASSVIDYVCPVPITEKHSFGVDIKPLRQESPVKGDNSIAFDTSSLSDQHQINTEIYRKDSREEQYLTNSHSCQKRVKVNLYTHEQLQEVDEGDIELMLGQKLCITQNLVDGGVEPKLNGRSHTPQASDATCKKPETPGEAFTGHVCRKRGRPPKSHGVVDQKILDIPVKRTELEDTCIIPRCAEEDISPDEPILRRSNRTPKRTYKVIHATDTKKKSTQRSSTKSDCVVVKAEVSDNAVEDLPKKKKVPTATLR